MGLIAVLGLSLVAVNRPHCCAWASRCNGCSCFGAWVLGAQASGVVACGLSDCGAWALLPHGM